MWKCCRLKFQNANFLVASDGDTLRIRGGGAIQEECELVDCDSPNIKEINMNQDIILQQAKEK